VPFVSFVLFFIAACLKSLIAVALLDVTADVRVISSVCMPSGKAGGTPEWPRYKSFAHIKETPIRSEDSSMPNVIYQLRSTPNMPNS